MWKCEKCGACCKVSPYMSDPCLYFKNGRCTIYKRRPDSCVVRINGRSDAEMYQQCITWREKLQRRLV